MRNQWQSSSQKGVPLGRFNSFMTVQSLAQVHNPVLVDNVEDPSSPGKSTHPVISYGPTSRRFSATQRRPVELSDHAHSPQLTRFPTKISPPDQGKILRSRSQDRNPKMQVLRSKASDISNGALQQSAFMQRLDDIEGRQANIESLLTQISQNIGGNNKS